MSSPVQPDPVEDFLRLARADIAKQKRASEPERPADPSLRRMLLERAPEFTLQGKILGAAGKAANTALFGLGPKISGGIRALLALPPGGESPGEAFTRGTTEARKRLRDFSLAEPKLSKAATVAGLLSSGLAAAPRGAIQPGAIAAAKIAGKYGLLGGAASGLAESEGSLPKQAAQIAASAGIGGAAGAAGGAVLSRLLAPGGGLQQTLASVRGEPVIQTSMLTAAGRGRAAVTEAVEEGGTPVRVAQWTRRNLLPEIAKRAPVIAQAGPQEAALFQESLRRNPSVGRVVEKDLRKLWQTRRRFGDELERLTIIRKPGQAPVSLEVTSPGVAKVLSEEAARVPAFQDVLADAAQTVARRGRPIGPQASMFEGTVGEAMEAGIPIAKLPRDVQAGAKRIAGKARNDLSGNERALFNLKVAPIETVTERPLTTEYLQELRKSVARVATRGFQPGSKDTGTAVELGLILDKVDNVLLNLPEMGPAFKRALRGWRETGDVITKTAANTGARPVLDRKGVVKAGRFIVSAHQPSPGTLDTPAARFMADLLIPLPTITPTPMGIQAGTIPALRHISPKIRKSTTRSAAELLLRRGREADNLWKDIARRLKPANVPAGPMRVPGILAGQGMGLARQNEQP